MPTSPSSIVVIGATSLIAEHCTRLWLSSGATSALLVGRSGEKLEKIATDLRVRYPSASITTEVTDLLDPQAISRSVTEFTAGGEQKTVLIAHGSMIEQRESQAELGVAAQVLTATGVSPSLWLEATADALHAGTIAIIGSVAGDRGRKKNYIYGAAKGLIEGMAQGLQHRLAGSSVRVVLVKPGPTDTPMTAQLRETGMSLASVESVAQEIVSGINAGRPVVYAPGKWRIIMAIIRLIPAPIFNRLNL